VWRTETVPDNTVFAVALWVVVGLALAYGVYSTLTKVAALLGA
jgi:hypothetical protein